MSCGVAFFDYDNDGWLDILVLSGSRFGDPPADASNRLYKNNRDGTFTDVTRKAGLFRTGYTYGVTVGDYNNDGFEDLFLTGWGQNALYRNNGDGTFTDVTKEAGLLNAQARFGSGCAFVDYDRDGRLDLFVSNYLAFDIDTVPRGRPVEELQYRRACSAGRAGCPTAAIRSITTTATARLPMSRRPPASARRRAATDSPWSPRTSTMTGGPISMSPAIPPPA